jgi:hypothetical protein
VQDLKNILAKQTNVPAGQQRLMLKGKPLSTGILNRKFNSYL